MKTIQVDSERYVDSDDSLVAAAEDFAASCPSVEGWALNPRWADEHRDTILLDVPDVDEDSIKDRRVGPSKVTS